MAISRITKRNRLAILDSLPPPAPHTVHETIRSIIWQQLVAAETQSRTFSGELRAEVLHPVQVLDALLSESPVADAQLHQGLEPERHEVDEPGDARSHEGWACRCLAAP